MSDTFCHVKNRPCYRDDCEPGKFCAMYDKQEKAMTAREPTEAMRETAYEFLVEHGPLLVAAARRGVRADGFDALIEQTKTTIAALTRALAEQDTAARLAGFAEAREMAAQTAENAISNVDSRGHWSDPSRDEIAREIRALSVTPPEAASEKENEGGP